MRKTILAAALPLLLAAPAAWAAQPEGGPAEGSPEQKIAELAVKISRALRENEEALARLARGEKGDPKAVDVSLPPSGVTKEQSAGGGT